MSSEPDFRLFSTLRYDPVLRSIGANTKQWDGETSLSSGCPFYLLAFHRDRILQAAEYFGWTKAVGQLEGPKGLPYLLSKLEEQINTKSETTPLRVKVLVDHNGDITIEHNALPPVSEFNLFPKRIPPPEGDAKVSLLTGGVLTVGAGDAVHGDPEVGDVYVVVPDTIRTKPTPYTSYKTTKRDMYSGARERVGIESFSEKKEVLILSENDGEITEGSLTSVFFWRGGKWTTPPVSSGGQVGTTRRWALDNNLCVEGVVKAQDLVDGEKCWISNGARGFILGKIKLS